MVKALADSGVLWAPYLMDEYMVYKKGDGSKITPKRPEMACIGRAATRRRTFLEAYGNAYKTFVHHMADIKEKIKEEIGILEPYESVTIKVLGRGDPQKGVRKGVAWKLNSSALLLLLY